MRNLMTVAEHTLHDSLMKSVRSGWRGYNAEGNIINERSKTWHNIKMD